RISRRISAPPSPRPAAKDGSASRKAACPPHRKAHTPKYAPACTSTEIPPFQYPFPAPCREAQISCRPKYCQSPRLSPRPCSEENRPCHGSGPTVSAPFRPAPESPPKGG